MRIVSRISVWLRRQWLEVLLSVGFVALLVLFAGVGYGFVPKPPPTPTPLVGQFDGAVAFRHVLAQMEIGPRPTGSSGSIKTGDYIIAQLKAARWNVEVQEFVYKGTKARNIIGKAGKGPVALIGAHYDTRRRADSDPDLNRRSEPVPGANDGASGVAVLLELARSLDKPRLSHEVWLTFFDAEDNGGLDGWEFTAGSQYMADNLTTRPQFVVIVDMVGDADQRIYRERNSTPALQDELWAVARRLGYAAYFIPEYKWAMIDDHTPFLQKGIPAVDLIDFDYPYWHTTQDTIDKVSAESLLRVGRVLHAFLEGR